MWADETVIDGSLLGTGYGLPTADLQQGRFRPADNVLFIMTGGTPGLYAYRETFQA